MALVPFGWGHVGGTLEIEPAATAGDTRSQSSQALRIMSRIVQQWGIAVAHSLCSSEFEWRMV